MIGSSNNSRQVRSGLAHSQLTLISLDALGGTEALSCVDVANVGMAVTLACCKDKKRKRRSKDVSSLVFENS